MNSSEFIRLLKNPGLLNHETLQATENLIRNYPAFDLGWGLWIRNLKILNSGEYSGKLPAAALRVQDRKWLGKFLELPGETDNQELNTSEYLSISDYSLGSTPQETNNALQPDNKMVLIDHFLATGRDASRRPEHSETAVNADMAEKSVAENDDIVTETFANILLSQGKYEKALSAFTKLSLKYPEKSIYFAARIEEVKSIMKR